MTVLVTGGAGFLGRHLVELLLQDGECPRVLVRPGEDVRGEVDIHRGDVADPAMLTAAMRGVDCVLHCAARTGPWGPPGDYERVNVRALETLVRTALAAGVDRVVHVSSITVHGNDVRGTADETAPLRAEPNPYSRSKVAGERLLERMIHEQAAPVTIVRPGWIYGPGDRASFGRLAEKVASGRMVVIGDGGNHLPLVYVRDVARGILLAAEAEQAVGRTYLLVNDEPVTQCEFLDAIAAELRVPAPKRHLPYRVALTAGAAAEALGRLTRRREPPPVTRYGLQLLGGENRFVITRAREELGFDPQVDHAEGVRRTLSPAMAVAA